MINQNAGPRKIAKALAPARSLGIVFLIEKRYFLFLSIEIIDRDQRIQDLPGGGA
jgi:hypothetical protein